MSRGRDILLAAESESDWRTQVLVWAKAGQWLVFSIHDSRRQTWGTDPGWPDLFLVRGEEALAVELKRDNGRLRHDQEGWLAALAMIPGIRVRVWRPRMADEVRAILLEGVPVQTQVRRISMAGSVVNRRGPRRGNARPSTTTKRRKVLNVSRIRVSE